MGDSVALMWKLLELPKSGSFTGITIKRFGFNTIWINASGITSSGLCGRVLDQCSFGRTE
jgi:hypothetical protein